MYLERACTMHDPLNCAPREKVDNETSLRACSRVCDHGTRDKRKEVGRDVRTALLRAQPEAGNFKSGVELELLNPYEPRPPPPASGDESRDFDFDKNGKALLVL